MEKAKKNTHRRAPKGRLLMGQGDRRRLLRLFAFAFAFGALFMDLFTLSSSSSNHASQIAFIVNTTPRRLNPCPKTLLDLSPVT